MKSNFFAFASRIKYIHRWALMRNTTYETLSQHSYEVATLAHALAVIGNRRFQKNYDVSRAALLGLYHDVPEIITGDMPTPVKYHSKEMRTAFAAVEQYASARLLSMLPDDLRADYEPLLSEEATGEADLHVLVKAADKLSAYIKCIKNARRATASFPMRSALRKRRLKKCSVPKQKFL